MTQTAIDIDSRPLPPGWKWVKLEEICQIILGQSPPGSTYRKHPDGLPFFQGKADFGEVSPTATTWCVEPNKIAEAGDILMSVRAPVGPTNLADARCCIGRGIAAIRCQSSVDTHFLLSAIKLFESSISSMGSGSTFQAITGQQLRTLQFPLPPIEEQKRISAILNEQMAAVDKAKKAAEERLKAAKALPAAYLREVFEGEELKGCSTKHLSTLCREDREITYGVIQTGDEIPGGVPVIRAGDISPHGIDLETLKRIDPLIAAEYERTILKGREIVISIRGSVGYVGIVTDDLTGCNISREVAVIDLISEVHKLFVFHYLRSPHAQAELTGKIVGAAQRGINLQDLRQLSVPVPTIEEQQQIASTLEDNLMRVTLAGQSIQQELETIKAMPAALLRKAFAGEL